MFSRYLPGPSPLPWYAAGKTVRVGDVVSWDQRWRPLQTSTTLDTHQATFRVLAPRRSRLISRNVCGTDRGHSRSYFTQESLCGNASVLSVFWRLQTSPHLATASCWLQGHLSVFKWLPVKRHASCAKRKKKYREGDAFFFYVMKS